MGVERPNVVLYTLGGPRGSSGLRILLSYLYPHFIFRRLLCRPYPPSHPLPLLLGIESLRLGFLVPLSPPPPFRIARGKKPASSLSLSLCFCTAMGEEEGGEKGGGGGRRGLGRESYFFSRAPWGRVDDFCDDFAWKINTHPRQPGRQAHPSL